MLQFHSDQLYKVLRDFYTLTQIRIVLLDSEFHELLSYPRDRFAFCSMIRSDPGVDFLCRRSDRDGCLRCAKSRDLVLYRCHAGLTEAVVPISDKHGVMGYVMFGQILPQEGFAQARAQLQRKYDEDRFPGIAAVIDAIPAKTTEELNAAATVLQALTAYVLTNRWITPGKAEFIRQLDHYVETHLEESITMEALCAAFHMGRTRLYSIAADYLGCGLAAYIRKQRILHAQRLLLHTDRAVSDIAYATGFTDYNHFSRVFKDISGVSAREYRNTARKQPPEA